MREHEKKEIKIAMVESVDSEGIRSEKEKTDHVMGNKRMIDVGKIRHKISRVKGEERSGRCMK